MRRVLPLLVAVASVAAATWAGPVPAATATTTAVVVIDTGTGAPRSATVDVGSGLSGLATLQRVASVEVYSNSSWPTWRALKWARPKIFRISSMP